MSVSTKRSVHVVLGAGGSRCIAYVGALRALSEMGYTFESISACSAGTIIGALVCAGLPPDKIESMILQADFKRLRQKQNIFSVLLAFFRWPHAIYRNSGVPSVVQELLTSDPKLKDLPIPFATIGVDLVSNEFVIYSSETEREMLVSEAVAIATAVPFAYPPYQKGGRIVVDAAVATQCPIWLSALQKTKSPILAFTCLNERNVETPRNFGDYLARILSAGAESGDEAMLVVMPRLHRIEIPCPKVDSTDLSPSIEIKRALLDAGKKAVRDFNLESTIKTTSASGLMGSENLVKTTINNYYKEVIMDNRVSVGGNAIINIDSVLNNVQQSLEQSAGLASDKKSELADLVTEFRVELEKIKESHSQEAVLITQRLQEVVQGASQPPEKRNSSLLQLSSKGLVDAAETVGNIVPKLLTTAGLIAKFVVGL
jgi:NTE family protein